MQTQFRIITPAFNCEESIVNTAYSIIGQTNKNWKWVICDDMSTDGTASVAQDIISNNNLAEKLEIVTRVEKFGEVRNTLTEVERADPEEVIIRLDAGDWLTDLGCLDILSSLYEKYKPAVLWTAHRWAFTNQNISGPIDPKVDVYKQPWKSSHLKTFRAKELFGLNPSNFLDDNGDFIMIGCDQAIFLPMMERARRSGKPLIFLPMVMYHYDINLEDPTLFTKPRSINQKMSAERLRERGYIE